MNSVPKILMVFVLVMIVIFAIFAVVNNVIDNQGSSLLEQGKNVEKGLDCVFANKESADQKCLKTSSSDEEDPGG